MCFKISSFKGLKIEKFLFCLTDSATPRSGDQLTFLKCRQRTFSTARMATMLGKKLSVMRLNKKVPFCLHQLWSRTEQSLQHSDLEMSGRKSNTSPTVVLTHRIMPSPDCLMFRKMILRTFFLLSIHWSPKVTKCRLAIKLIMIQLKQTACYKERRSRPWPGGPLLKKTHPGRHRRTLKLVYLFTGDSRLASTMLSRVYAF